MKWWLISDKNIQSIRKALEEKDNEDVLHDIDSGLNITDCVPNDWK